MVKYKIDLNDRNVYFIKDNELHACIIDKDNTFNTENSYSISVNLDKKSNYGKENEKYKQIYKDLIRIE